MDLDKINKVY